MGGGGGLCLCHPLLLLLLFCPHLCSRDDDDDYDDRMVSGGMKASLGVSQPGMRMNASHFMSFEYTYIHVGQMMKHCRMNTSEPFFPNTSFSVLGRRYRVAVTALFVPFFFLFAFFECTGAGQCWDRPGVGVNSLSIPALTASALAACRPISGSGCCCCCCCSSTFEKLCCLSFCCLDTAPPVPLV